jgi:hypothetical protein
MNGPLADQAGQTAPGDAESHHSRSRNQHGFHRVSSSIIRRGVIFWTTVSRSTCCQAQVSKMLTIAVFFFSHWATAAEKGDDRVSDTHARVSDTHANSHENISHSGSSGFGGHADTAETADLRPCLLNARIAAPLASLGWWRRRQKIAEDLAAQPA